MLRAVKNVENRITDTSPAERIGISGELTIKEGGWGGGGGCEMNKKITKCMKPNWNFQWGGGGSSYKTSLPWGKEGMDILWNYTM